MKNTRIRKDEMIMKKKTLLSILTCATTMALFCGCGNEVTSMGRTSVVESESTTISENTEDVERATEIDELLDVDTKENNEQNPKGKNESVTEEVTEKITEQVGKDTVNTKHDFRNSDWGDTLDDVKVAETELVDGVTTEADGGYFGYTGNIHMEEMENAPISVLYLFTPEGKLIHGVYTITYSTLNNEVLSLAVSDMNVFSKMVKDITGESYDIAFMDNDGKMTLSEFIGNDIKLPEDKTLCYYFPENCVLIQLDTRAEHPTLQVQFNGGWADNWKEAHGVLEWSK